MCERKQSISEAKQTAQALKLDWELASALTIPDNSDKITHILIDQVHVSCFLEDLKVYSASAMRIPSSGHNDNSAKVMLRKFLRVSEGLPFRKQSRPAPTPLRSVSPKHSAFRLALPLALSFTTLMGCPSASVPCPPFVRHDKSASGGAIHLELPLAQRQQTLVGWPYPSEQCPRQHRHRGGELADRRRRFHCKVEPPLRRP